MKIRKATTKEYKYACKHFHYSRCSPGAKYAYSFFNDQDEWVGTIVFGQGSCDSIGKPYDLTFGEILELVRVAFNGKQETTSQYVAAALKQLKKDAPHVRMLVSYADTGQGHVGTIYQATNWLYTGIRHTLPRYIVNGKEIHSRTLSSMRKNKPDYLEAAKVEIIPSTDKHKYLYFYDKKLKKKFQHLSQPYPKKEANAEQ